jgi:AMIN domain
MHPQRSTIRRRFCRLAGLANLVVVLSTALNGRIPKQHPATNTIAITRIEVSGKNDETTVRISADHDLVFQSGRLTNPDRVVLDFLNAHFDLAHFPRPIVLDPIHGIRIGQVQSNVARVVIDLQYSCPYSIYTQGQTVFVSFVTAPTVGVRSDGSADSVHKRPTTTARSQSPSALPTSEADEEQDSPRPASPVPLSPAVTTLSATPELQSDLPSPPVTTSLETGQVLTDENGVISAYHQAKVGALWTLGHLYLLSVSTFYEHDTNFEFKPQGQAANAVAAQGLILISFGTAKTALDIQYRPYLLFAQGEAQADFLANSLDIHTFHFLNARWLLNFDDRFQYLPARGRLIDPTVDVDFASGVISSGPFLAADASTLYNDLSVAASDHFLGHDTLTFHGQYQYVDDWSVPNSAKSTVVSAPTPTLSSQENLIGGGGSWDHEVSDNLRLGISYNYERQVLGGIRGESQYHSLFVNYSQMIRPSVLVQLSFGPSWGIYGASSQPKSTYVGSGSFIKKFQVSDIALSYARSEDYSGVIANGYYSRYDGSFTRSLGSHLELVAGGGYLQQSFNGLSNLDAREEWGRMSWFVTRELGFFASVANIGAQGSTLPDARRTLLSTGLRWGYQQRQSEQP